MDSVLTLLSYVVADFKMKLRSLLGIFLKSIFSLQYFVVFETSVDVRFKTKVNTPRVSVRIAHFDDVPKFSIFKKFRKGDAMKRLKAGHICFIGEKNGEIVSYIWICFQEAYIDELERKIQVAPSYAYGYDYYTNPDFRRTGIFTTVFKRAVDYLSQNGVKGVYDLVSSDNLPSMKAHAKIGSQKIGEIMFMRLFSLKKYGCKAGTSRDCSKLRTMFCPSLARASWGKSTC